MYSVTCVEDLQDLNPYVIVGAGGGGEKFSNLEGIETVGFLDDNPQKQGKPFCGLEVASNLDELFETTDAKTVAIMLPIGAEGAALKYAVQALASGKNVIVSFRSLSLSDNESLLKLADQNDVVIKKCCEVLPKISYTPKASVIFCGGTSQECGKRTTTKSLGKEATKRGIKNAVISTDEMGLEQPTYFNFRAGSLSAMDIPSAILSAIKYVEEREDVELIFVEGQSSLTEMGNPHPRGLSAAILIGAHPDAVVVGHRPNHPYREPRGIAEEIKAIEAVEPTKVVGLSINLRNAPDETVEDYEKEFGLPAADMYHDGAAKILDAILEHLGKN